MTAGPLFWQPSQIAANKICQGVPHDNASPCISVVAAIMLLLCTIDSDIITLVLLTVGWQ